MALVTFRNILEEDTVFTEIKDKEYLIPCVHTFACTQNDEVYNEVMGQKVSLYVNGSLIKVDDWHETTITSEDVIIITPKIRKGDLGGLIEVAIGALLIAASFIPFFEPAAPFLFWTGVGLMLGGVSQLLFQPDLPSLPFFSGGGGGKESQTYNWSGMKTVAKTDTPIPVVYGTHKIAGNLIGIYTDSYGSENYLNMLIALCEGEIDGICQEQDYSSVCQTSNKNSVDYTFPAIELDDQPLRVYNDVTWWYRTGTGNSDSNDEYYPFAQNMIPYFDAAKVQYTDGRSITTDSIEYTTHKDVDMITVMVRADSLFHVSGPSLVNQTAKYKIEWKLEGGSYSDYEVDQYSITVTAGTDDTNPNNCRVKCAHGDYFYGEPPQVKAIKITYNGFERADYGWGGFQLWDGYGFPWHTMFAFYDVKADIIINYGDSDETVIERKTWTVTMRKGMGDEYPVVHSYNWVQLENYMALIYSSAAKEGNVFVLTPTLEGSTLDLEITGKTKSPVWNSVTLNFNEITGAVGEDTYVIRLTRTDGGPSSDFHTEDAILLDSVVEIVQGKFIYPHTALLGLRIKATDQLSGAPPNITTVVRGKKVEVPDLEDASPSGTNASFDDCYWDDTNSIWIDDNSATRYWNDTSSWRTEYSNNPMVCVRDAILSTRYGLGNYISTSDLSDTDIISVIKDCHIEYDPFPGIDYLPYWNISAGRTSVGEPSWNDYFDVIPNSENITITYGLATLQLTNSEDEFSKVDIRCKVAANLSVNKKYTFSITVADISSSVDIISFYTVKKTIDGDLNFERLVGSLSNVTDGTYTKEFVCRHPGIYEVVVSVENDSGLGIKFTDISLSRNTYSHYHTMDGVLESDQSALTALMEMCSSFRCWPVWYNGTFGFVYDKDDTPIHSLSVAKTISFKQSFTPLSEIPYRLIAQFTDRDDNYNMRSMIGQASDFSDITKLNEKTMGLKFISDKPKAERELIFKLNRITNCTHNVEVKCGLDKIHATAGDIINIQNDLPSWGIGGRILDYTSTNITLDATYTFDNVATDTFLIKYHDSENNDVTATIDTTSISNNDVRRVMPLKSTMSASPHDNSGYSMGVDGTYVKKFRMLSVKRNRENEVSFVGVEHLSSLYTESSLCHVEEPPLRIPNPLAKPKPPRRIAVRQTSKYEGIGFSFYAEFSEGDNNIKEVIVKMNKSGRCPWAKAVFDIPEPDLFVDTQENKFETVAVIPANGGSAKYIDSNLAVGCLYDFRFVCRTQHKISDFVETRELLSTMEYKPDPPSGLHIIRSWSPPWQLKHWAGGNYTQFHGKDIEVTWNPVGVTYNTALTIIGYKVEVYSSSTINSDNLLRTAFTPTEEYTYTLEDNISDSNNSDSSPSSTVAIRVSSVNAVNIESDPCKPICVTAANPPAVTGLTATAQGDAVLFEWDKSTIPSLRGYYYRTQVESDGWSSWVTTENNKVLRQLTASERVRQANSRSTIYIEVKVETVYGKYSSTATTNEQCLNNKREFVVATLVGKGDFTNLGSAIASVPADGWGIIIKEGTYDLSSSVHFPNYSFDIEGVNRDAVIVRNAAGEHGLCMVNNSAKSYHISNFTMTSQNMSNESNMIYIYDSTATRSSYCDVAIDNMKFNLSSSVDDCGIYSDGNFSAFEYGKRVVSVNGCIADGGSSSIRIHHVNIANVKNNICRNTSHSGAYINSIASIADISDNIVVDSYRYGMYINVYGADAISNISGNSIITATTIDTWYCGGIYANGDVIVSNNNIRVNGNVTESIYGIYSSNYNKVINNNLINIHASPGTDEDIKGIYLTSLNDLYCYDNIVSNNRIIIKNAIASSNKHYGIYIRHGDRNVINGNSIDLTNNTSSDIGIYLDSDSDNNYGDGNITYNCGVSVDDNGSGDYVSAKDI